MTCSQCGQSVSRGVRSCAKCGSRLQSASVVRLSDFGLATASAVRTPGAATAYSTARIRRPSRIERVRNIVLTPRSEWQVIETEVTTPGRLYTGYIVPLAAFAAVMSFIRLAVIGVNLPLGGAVRTPLFSGLLSSALTFIMGLIGIHLVGVIINMLAPAFGGHTDSRQALKLAAYALTPAWLGSALAFLPLGSTLQLVAGLYGVYVLYLGLPVLMRTEQSSAVGYAASVVSCTVWVGILFAMVAAGALAPVQMWPGIWFIATQ
jgi:hypothetical protein